MFTHETIGLTTTLVWDARVVPTAIIWGDGQKTEAPAGGTATHTYTEAGNYVVGAYFQDPADGVTASVMPSYQPSGWAPIKQIVPPQPSTKPSAMFSVIIKAAE